LPTLGGCLLVDTDEQKQAKATSLNKAASLLLGQPVYGSILVIPGG